MSNLDLEREHIERSDEELDERVISKYDNLVNRLLFKIDESLSPGTISHVEAVGSDDDVVVTQRAVMMTKRFFNTSGYRTRVDFLSSSDNEGKSEQCFHIEVDVDPDMPVGSFYS